MLSNFSTGALAPCRERRGVCLRNDLAPVVLWYNATLMKQWGYQVPTTWPQYEQIGQEVAKQHPGYIVGRGGHLRPRDLHVGQRVRPTTSPTSER